MEQLFQVVKYQIKRVIGLKNYDIVFMLGVIEVNNLVLKGVVLLKIKVGKYIIVIFIEYLFVMELLEQLIELFGFDVIYFLVNEDGFVLIEELK